MIAFRKVHGAGNDFILLADPPEVRDWAGSRRGFAIGGWVSAVTGW